MSGALAGALLGAGLFCAWWSCWPRPPRTPGRRARRSPLGACRDLLAAAAVPAPAAALPLVSAGAAALAGLLVAGTTGVPVLALGAALAAGWAPAALLRARARTRRADRAELWPDAVDHLAAAVRAGTSLPDAVCALAVRGPVALRPVFARFAAAHRASGAFEPELARLVDELADPVFDRVAAALRMTRQVGGSDLGATLRTLSAHLRDDLRTRGELRARQSWTVSAARLAVAAPWAVLALLAGRPGALDAYATPAGTAVLVAGALVSALAYRLMLRLGRLPAPRRVLVAASVPEAL
ncbi:type II secretion system F family protein [Kineococcus terrestris]|uniref:type II secretion system F family protein n=1 Tax=Kineococcus terrestris TaxID=2044856 RepID=UPI0034DAE9B0